MNIIKFFAGILFLAFITGQAGAHVAETNGILLDYGNNWRISGKSPDMITLTHTEKPGEVLLSVSKIPTYGGLSDMWNMHKEKLDSFGAEIEQMPPGNVAGQSTIRFLTRLPNQQDVAVLNHLFEANGNFYLATVTAKDADFITYAGEAEPVFKSMSFTGKTTTKTDIIAPESTGIVGRITSAVKNIGGKITGAVKSIFGTIKGLIGFNDGEKIQPTTQTLTKTLPPVKTLPTPKTTSPPATFLVTLETSPPITIIPTTTITLPPTTISTTSTTTTSTTPSTTVSATTTSTTIPVPKGPVLELIDIKTVENIDDKLWVAGMIRNTGGSETLNVKVLLTVYNSQGAMLQTLSTPPIDVVLPGETVEFNPLRSDIINSAVGSYELSLDYQEQ